MSAGKSQITGMLLSNYILSINLLRSIATKFSDPQNYESAFTSQMDALSMVEQALQTHNTLHPNELLPTNVKVSYLIKQHKKEILNVHSSYADVVRLSFNSEF